MNDAQQIHGFFANLISDHAGRTIQDYLEMSNDDLETIHDYIQWAFPTRKASQFGDHAPLLSDAALALVKADLTAMGNYYGMFGRMLKFYETTEHWLVDHDHNHLRITRIIESSGEIFNTNTAQYFLNVVLRCNKDANEPINKESIAFWMRTMDAVIALRDDPNENVELVDGFYVPKQTEN